MVDKLSPERRSWNMSRIKGKNTKPELLLRSLLHKRGFRFRVHDKRLPGTPDIVLPRYKTIILVHGCFWHRHPNCRYASIPKTKKKFWSQKFKDTIQRDKEQEILLKKEGWSLIVVWECELKQDSHNVVEKISAAVHKRQSCNN